MPKTGHTLSHPQPRTEKTVKPAAPSEETITLTIRNRDGLHARPAALLVRLVNCFDASVTVSDGAASANAKSILGIMALGISHGSRVTFTAQGRDARDVLAAITDLVNSGFQDPMPFSGAAPATKSTRTSPSVPAP